VFSKEGARHTDKGPIMKMPPQDQIDIAIAWLETNEGEGAERTACEAVAEWLAAVSFEDHLRRSARNAGVPVAALRRKMAAHR
jgi:hypothetical protein